MGLSRELTLATLLLLATRAFAQAPGLVATSWQLVKLQSGDGGTLTPDDKSKYTFTFATGGVFNARIDCNRGSGSWKSPGPGLLQIAPFAITRAMCPTGSLYDPIVQQLGFVRSYVIKDGRLSLMADGGTFELEPIAFPGQK